MRTIAFDTETWLIAPGRLAPKMVCLSYATGEGVSKVINAELGLSRVRVWLEAGDITLVGHNVAFDLGVCVQADPSLMTLIWRELDAGRIRCTMVHEKLRKIALGRSRFDFLRNCKPKYSLAALVDEYLGEQVEGKSGPDIWRLRYRELDGVPIAQWPAAAHDYALKDAEYTLRIHQKQQAEGEPPTLNDQVKAAWALHLMSAWGMRTDAVAVAQLELAIQDRIAKVMPSLKLAGIVRENGTKDIKAVKARVEEAYGVDTPKTDKGNVKTDERTLRDSGDPVLLELANIGTDQKELNTYIPILKAGAEYPINPRYNVLVDSGRTSCRGPNIQNQPRRPGVRECYIPRPGWVYITCDYGIAELRALAQVLVDLYGQSAMADALKDGRELHLEMAAQILGCTYDQAMHRYEDGDQEAKDARDLAKPCNFGFPGGLGPERFIEFATQYVKRPDNTFPDFVQRFTLDYAADLKEKWLTRFPEMRDYFRDVGRWVNDGGGRFMYVHPRTGFIRGDVGFCDGCNHGFQHLVAAGAKAACVEVARECYAYRSSNLFGTRPVAFVHDEIIVEAPIAQAPVAARRLEIVMVRALQQYLPDVPVTAEAALMTRWWKGAQPAHKDGTLVPWTPQEKAA